MLNEATHTQIPEAPEPGGYTEAKPARGMGRASPPATDVVTNGNVPIAGDWDEPGDVVRFASKSWEEIHQMAGFRSLKSASITAVLAGTLMFSGATSLLAQDSNAGDAPDINHPAHIHSGTCDDLDPNPAAPLQDIVPYANDPDSDEGSNSPQGVLTAPIMLHSETDVEMSLDDLLAEPHAINVHESMEQIENYVACGDIGGILVTDNDGTMAIGISPLNDSGIYGIAFLHRDDDNTRVDIWLAQPRAEEEPSATPMS